MEASHQDKISLRVFNARDRKIHTRLDKFLLLTKAKKSLRAMNFMYRCSCRFTLNHLRWPIHLQNSDNIH